MQDLIPAHGGLSAPLDRTVPPDREDAFREETASLAALAVSDAHTLGELGRAYTEFAEFDGSALSLKDAVSRGSMVGRRAPLLVHAVTSWVKIKKRLLGTDRGSP